MPPRPSRDRFLVGVAGGTGSGKTTVARRLADAIGASSVALVTMDAYYRVRDDLELPERLALNYDHPAAFDWDLLRAHLDRIGRGLPIDQPVYDFSAHTRSPDTVRVPGAPVVVVEGILALYDAGLRAAFDLSVYVDTDADVRFIRRLQRDVAERGRTPDAVIEQYLTTVRPSHLQFVEPTKRYADVILPHGGRNEPGVGVLLARIRELVGER